MRTRRLLIGLAIVLSSAIAQADKASREKKFCAAIADFNSDVKSVDAIGPNSTLAELRAALDRLSTDAHKVEKTASRIRTETAKQFGDATQKLRKDANALSETMTIDQARTKLEGDIRHVKEAARKLTTESGCPEEAPPMEKESQTPSTTPQP